VRIGCIFNQPKHKHLSTQNSNNVNFAIIISLFKQVLTMKYTSIAFFLLIASTVSYSNISLRFCGYNSDNPDSFSFFSTDTLFAGQEIFFTDRNYDLDKKQFLNNTEGILLWQTDSTIPAGAVVAVSADSATSGNITEIEAGFNIANTNDIIWAFTYDNDQLPLFLSAFSTGAIHDSLLESAKLSRDMVGEFFDDNGQYNSTRVMKYSDLAEFYAQANWTFTDGTGSQTIELDTSPFFMKAEPATLCVAERNNRLRITATISPATSKTVICFDTIPIKNSNVAEWFHRPDPSHSIELDEGSPCVWLDNMQPGKFYYIKAISFSPQNNALLPSEEHAVPIPGTCNSIHLADTAVWSGNTAFFMEQGDSIKSKQEKNAGSIMFDRSQADKINVDIAPWNVTLSNQNNFGIVLSSDKRIREHPNNEYWNGYYLRFGKNSSDSVFIYQRKGNQNIAIEAFGPLSEGEIREDISISISYLSNNCIVAELKELNNRHRICATIPCTEQLCQQPYFGLFARTNNLLFSAKFYGLATEHYSNSYFLATNGNIADPSVWTPQRNIPFFSDQLNVENIDSATVEAEYFSTKTLTIHNSNIYITNTDTLSENIFSVNNYMSIDKTSMLSITNTAHSNKPCIFILQDNAILQVDGRIEVDALGTIPNHKIICQTASKILVNDEGKIIVNKLDGHLFESSIPEAIHFRIGSQFIQYDGKHPFGEDNSASAIAFDPGSAYVFHGGGLSLTKRSYQTLILDTHNATTFAMGSNDTARIESLQIQSGEYHFTSHANKLPITLEIQRMAIANGALLDLSPSEKTTSSIIISGEKCSLSGEGTLNIGNSASLRCISDSIGVRLNTTIFGDLIFSGTSTHMYADSCTITLAGAVIGAGQNAFIVLPEGISDSTCYVISPATKENISLSPIGTVSNGYSPVRIQLNTNDSVPFRVRVFNGIFENGLYGSVLEASNTLDQTWEITPERPTSAKIDLYWQAMAERNTFFRDYSKMAVNHHLQGNDNWHGVENSEYSVSNGLHHLKADTIRSFSTFSAMGDGSLLDLYFSSFTAYQQNSGIVTSWVQESPVDSARILASSDARTFCSIMTTTPHMHSPHVFLHTGPRYSYYKMVQYKYGVPVASSSPCFVAQPGKTPPCWNVFVVADHAIIQNPKEEILTIRWFDLSGKKIAELQCNSARSEIPFPNDSPTSILEVSSPYHKQSEMVIVPE